MKKIFFILSLLLISLIASSEAKAGSGSITVTATDGKGKFLSNASFRCSSRKPFKLGSVEQDTPKWFDFKTNAQGKFTWSIDPVVGYELSCYASDTVNCYYPLPKQSVAGKVTLSDGEAKEFTYLFAYDAKYCNAKPTTVASASPSPSATASATSSPSPTSEATPAPPKNFLQRIIDWIKSLFGR